MAIIEEVYEPPQPQPRYTGPAKPVMKPRMKPTPAVAPAWAASPALSQSGLSFSDPVGSVQLLLFDKNYWHILAGLLLLGECVLCGLIIKFVPCESPVGLFVSSPSSGRRARRKTRPTRPRT